MSNIVETRVNTPIIPRIETDHTGRLPYAVTTLACPPWCDETDARHDTCQGSRARIPLADQGAALAAYLFRLDDSTPVLAVYSDDSISVELDVDGVDALIEDVEAFLPQLRAMRAQLAAGGAR
ncbi:DUF6907 domain-containing protein [Streptomyces niveus]|uniref:DUF6907 domain-containing protein n=1 Tax=Streptomyces niveus TaxID=193462 RepID=UPI00369823D6